VTVLTAVRVSVTDDVVIVVIDGEMAINLVVLVNSVVDAVLVGTEDGWIVLISVLDDVLVYVFEIFSNEKSNSSVAPTDECHDRWFVCLEPSSSLFLSPRSRGLSCFIPFSPATT